MKAWGRLLRLSLAPTAAADVAAGAVAGAGAWPGGGTFVLMLASLCVYHGGMALNDWADRKEDLPIRPDRPIPSGAVSSPAALAAGIALLVSGPLIALSVSTQLAAVLLAVSAAACAYDLRLRGAVVGPLVLAACRGGDLSAGILFGAGSAFEPRMLVPAAVYAAYVFAVSSLGRLEDAPEAVLRSSRPAVQLSAAALLLALSPLSVLAWRSAWTIAALLVACAGAAGLVRRARSAEPWSGAEVTRATGLGLRRLLVFTAALSLASGSRTGAIVAAAILAGYPISYFLRGVFPPS